MSFSLHASLGPPGPRLLLRARVVAPVAAPPIDNGAVLLSGRRILKVGAWPDVSAMRHQECLDLGDSILLPGLVNAHCHLDYTDMAGQISPTPSFSEWIRAILALKAQRGYSEYALSWLRGAKMLLAHGTTTVADIEAVPELLPEVLSATPLRVCSLRELTGLRGRRPFAEIVGRALEPLAQLQAQGYWVGLSPHAPYSTTPELLRLAARAARQRDWLMAVHVAESAEEFEMFTRARGLMFNWLRSQRAASDCGVRSPIAHLEREGALGPNLLAIHANYLAPGDAERLGASQASVVHCPRSHAYFGHEPFPRSQLERAGVNICLGTDSLATVRRVTRRALELDLFSEMRTATDADRALSPEESVRWATVNGARALHRTGELGEISEGALADLITIPAPRRLRDTYEAIVNHAGPVSGTMINGCWMGAPSARVGRS